MNYRHAYHAGSFTDVFKHCVLLALTKSLLKKDKAFCYLDTHAGLGRYDLQSVEALKTLESQMGIYQLLNAKVEPPPLIADYLQIIRQLNNPNEMRYYPGSPRIVRALLRLIDRMILCELHKDDVVSLKQEFIHDKQVAVHHMDGYQALKAFLPPKERRGLILIDPPFEKENEFDTIIENLMIAFKRWSSGIYAIWYPIKHPLLVKDFLKEIQLKISEKLLITELEITAYKEDALSACGVAIINPPWQIEDELQVALHYLQKIYK